MAKQTYPPIVTTPDGVLYRYHGMEGDKFSFEHLATGKRGLMTLEDSKTWFSCIPFSLNMLVSVNPCIADLISSCNLKMEMKK